MCERPNPSATLLRVARRAALAVFAFAALSACSELARTGQEAPPDPGPSYIALAASYLKSNLKNPGAFDGFEISGVRWVHSVKGWSWLACVHFRDHQHPRTYALFLDEYAVVDGRYAVQTDACNSQTYTQFDPAMGVVGPPSTAALQPLY